MACFLSLVLWCAAANGQANQHGKAAAATWRSSTEAELRAILPARAPVVSERIETEFRASSGIVNNSGRAIAGVLLITAGYSAEGKYSYYMISQVTMKVGEITLRPGQYLFGWVRRDDALEISFYEAETGKALGTVEARPDPAIHRVESFRIWRPEERSIIQIGRFSFVYKVEPQAS